MLGELHGSWTNGVYCPHYPAGSKPSYYMPVENLLYTFPTHGSKAPSGWVKLPDAVGEQLTSTDCTALDARLTAAEARVRELEDVVKPFANLFIHDLRDRPDDQAIYGRNDTHITVGNIRAARNALAKGGEGEGDE